MKLLGGQLTYAYPERAAGKLRLGRTADFAEMLKAQPGADTTRKDMRAAELVAAEVSVSLRAAATMRSQGVTHVGNVSNSSASAAPASSSLASGLLMTGTLGRDGVMRDGVMERPHTTQTHR